MDREPAAVRQRAGVSAAPGGAGLVGEFRLPDPAWTIGKNGLLCLDAAPRDGRTAVTVVRRRIPYQWQGYQYQDCDDQPFVVLHNSSGGFVEDDSAVLQLRAAAGSRVLLTTSAANRFYKTENGGSCRDDIDIEVGDDGLLEYLPDEIIPYATSAGTRITRIHIAASARLFASDIISAGRVSYGEGERFAFRSFHSELELKVDGRLEVLDRLIAGTPDECRAFRDLWGGYDHMTTILIHAPDLPIGLDDAIHDLFGDCPGTTAGVTRQSDVICVRMLSQEVWQAHEAVWRIWAATRPIVAGKKARRINKP